MDLNELNPLVLYSTGFYIVRWGLFGFIFFIFIHLILSEAKKKRQPKD